ncbi:MAG: nucleotidyltransferase domain-containing protein [Sumerlaeia bacterium]
MGRPNPKHVILADELGKLYGRHREVVGVALGGSAAVGMGDDVSDIDLYVYLDGELPLAAREKIARGRSDAPEVGNAFWEPGDEWVERASGMKVDVMFRQRAWMDEQVARVLDRHEASLGYTTCFLYNVARCRIVQEDKEDGGWLRELRKRVDLAPYPEELKRAIVAKNHPVLRGKQASYRDQIASAVARGDLVSVNHRVAAALASVFDILFAVDEQYHPGEKRLLAHAEAMCPKRPESFRADVEGLLRAAGSEPGAVAGALERLLDGLDGVLRGEGLIGG